MNEDLEILILSYLEPHDIVSFYNSSNSNKNILQNLSQHPGFIIKCTAIIDDYYIDWFNQKNIKLDLIKEFKQSKNTCKWFENDELHRDNDLPAVIWSDGSKMWYKRGKPHRDNDLPAVHLKNDFKAWYKNGQKHRDGDLPAEILPDGTKYWYKNDQLWRDNELAWIEYGTKKYDDVIIRY